MFVKYAPKEAHVKVVPVATGGVTLRPGINEVADETWEAMRPHLAQEVACGVIRAFSVSTGKGGATTLKDAPVAVAAKIVAGCSSADTLRAWLESGLSDEVARLVLRRMRRLGVEADEGTEDAEDALSDAAVIDEGAEAVDEVADGSPKPDAKRPDAKKTEAKKPDARKPDAKKGGGSGAEDIPDFDDPDAKVK